jgi:1-aminocyclopropane-1-carboxylate deaminase
MNIALQNIRTDKIKNLYQPFAVELDVLRLDLIHPIVSGNKWFKLHPYLDDAIAKGKSTIVTFGGAYSNHILATAAACQAKGLRAIGIIRGEEPQSFSPTLRDAITYGMELVFVSREEYKTKTIPAQISTTQNYYTIPEGGYGEKGKTGAAAISEFADISAYTHIICATGTGTTLAGLISTAHDYQKILGISVMKNNFSLFDEVNALLDDKKHHAFELFHDFHFGGYAKYNDSLVKFMNNWYEETGIPSDFVYTGKTFFATDHLIRKRFFHPADRILVLHSGGLQGNRSLKTGTLIF